jgi:hypothetical protein
MSDLKAIHVDITREGWQDVHVRIPAPDNLDDVPDFPAFFGELVGMALTDLIAQHGPPWNKPLPEAVSTA